jgi:hypothetical protein
MTYKRYASSFVCFLNKVPDCNGQHDQMYTVYSSATRSTMKIAVWFLLTHFIGHIISIRIWIYDKPVVISGHRMLRYG